MSAPRILPATIWKACALLSVALALLTPLGAAAHSTHAQDSATGAKATVAGLVPIATSPATGSPALLGGFRPCPDGPGNTCNCGVLSACTGSGKIAVANGNSWNVAAAPQAVRVARLLAREAPPPSRSLPPAPPRGPPLYS